MAVSVWFTIAVIWVLVVGARRFFLECRVRDQIGLRALLFPFHRSIWRKLTLAMLLKHVYYFLWSLTIVGLPIKHYSYKMVPYLLAENPNLKPREAIMLSRQMMDGQKWRCFVMDVTIYLPLPVYIVFAMFVMVGCDNAVNLTDGIDGLSSSVTIPVMVFFTAASVALKRYDLALMPAAMIGGLLAYLSLNWHPAKLFMGDTGSLFMGGVVCAMSFALDMPLVLILVGFVYICETLSVILQVTYFKLTHGKRLFKMSPIHHHFEMCGWKEEKIVLIFAAVSALMCILAWFSISGKIG